MTIKKVLFLASVISLLIAGCGNADKEKEIPDEIRTDTTTRLPGDTAVTAAESPVKADPKPKSGPGDVLAKIDQYLVTTPAFTAPPGSEGITNGSVTIHNKLDNSTFQKALIEVSILLADGKEFRTDYYTVVNLAPGDNKVVKIPNTTRGVKVTSRVVKVKSNELTKGESVTVGNGYVPK